MSLGKKKRFEIFKRDSFTCVYCGRTPPAVVLEIDHMVPVSGGGTDEPVNLMTSCFDCNRGKSYHPLSERSSLEIQSHNLEQENEKLEQLRAINRLHVKLKKELDKSFRIVSNIWIGYEEPENLGSVEVAGDLRTTIYQFLELLPIKDVIEASEITNKRLQFRSRYDKTRYFAGICHNKVNGVVPPRKNQA